MKPMTYEKRIQLRTVSSLCIALLALALFLALLIFSENTNLTRIQISSYLGSFGGAGVANFVLFLHSRKLTKNPAALRKQELKEMDERAIFITRQTYTLYATISIALLYIAMIVLGFFSSTIYYTILVILCGELLLICGITLYMKKKY